MLWTNWLSTSREVFAGVRKFGTRFSAAKPEAVGVTTVVAGGVTPAPVLQDPLAQPAPPTHRERVGAIGDSHSSDSPTFDFPLFVLKIATLALWTAVGIVLLNLWKLGII